MRKIKFRAWDRVRKKWLTRFYVGMSSDVYDVIFGGWRKLDDINLIQFTGIKDKNDKEVYEGDIIKACIYGDEEPQKLDVEFRNGAFIIDYEDSEYDCINVGEFVGTIEIIGNIYENQELMD